MRERIDSAGRQPVPRRDLDGRDDDVAPFFLLLLLLLLFGGVFFERLEQTERG